MHAVYCEPEPHSVPRAASTISIRILWHCGDCSTHSWDRACFGTSLLHSTPSALVLVQLVPRGEGPQACAAVAPA